MKVHISAKVTFLVIKNGVVVDTPSFLYTTKSCTILRDADVHEVMGPTMSRLIEQIADQQECGSGFVFEQINYFHVTLAHYTPIKGGRWIPSPPWLSRKKATVNIQTTDDRCILDCINAQLHPAGANPHRLSHYKEFPKDIHVDGVNFPAGKRDIDKIEKLNPQFSINVYAYELIGKKGKRQKVLFYPYHISKNRGPDKTIINLLLMEEGDAWHYALIRDLAKLMRLANSKNHRTTFCCPYCLQHFKFQRLLDEHNPLCEQFKPITSRFPTKGKDDIMKFKSFEKQFPADYWLVFDFETKEVLREGVDRPPECPLPPEELKKYPWIIYPSQAQHAQNCRICSTMKPCPKISQSTLNHARLEPFSFGFKLVSSKGPEHDFPLRTYQGPDASKVFLKMLKEDMKAVNKILNRNIPLRMTAEDWRRHNWSTHCSVCRQKYTKENYKVKDHDHQTGRYR